MYIADYSPGERNRREDFRLGVPLNLQKEDPMILMGRDQPSLDHMFNVNDRGAVNILASWLEDRGFDTYLAGSVIRGHLLGDGKGYNDIDLCAVAPVGGLKGNGIVKLASEHVLGNRGIKELEFVAFGKFWGDMFDYTLKGVGNGFGDILNEKYVGLDNVYSRFILKPELTLRESRNKSKKKFSEIDLNFVNPDNVVNARR